MRLENIDCDATDCLFWAEHGYCSSPSGIIIDDRRRCISFRENFEKRKQELKNYVSKVVCSGEQEND